VRRVGFGYFVRPAEDAGTGSSRVEPCLGYLVEHPDGLLLMDTGIGTHLEVDAYYRPRRRSTALADAGARDEDVALVVNCRLHFDHCGDNPQLPGRPILTRRAELAAARGTDYTLPELVAAPGCATSNSTAKPKPCPECSCFPHPVTPSGTSHWWYAATTGTSRPCR